METSRGVGSVPGYTAKAYKIIRHGRSRVQGVALRVLCIVAENHSDSLAISQIMESGWTSAANEDFL